MKSSSCLAPVRPGPPAVEYLRTGHFVEAAFENWESEFLQMGSFVLLTMFLVQRGSAESKREHDDCQSEVLAVGSIVVLSIVLRQKGSPESEPVHEPLSSTGD